MTLLKRTFTSLTAKLDQLVGDIENHDALIQAAINEQKKKIAAAKIQLRKLHSSQERLKSQITQTTQAEQRWTERAASTAEESETKALACLQRRQAARAQLDKLNHMLLEYQLSAEKMSQNITHCEEDLASMMQKHQMLKARQCTADAMQMMEREGSVCLDDVEASFDRWEAKIAQGEYVLDRFDDVDELEREYVSAEKECELRAELAELLKAKSMEDV